MHYHAVVEQFTVYRPLDPIALILFAAVFAGCALAAAWRPGIIPALLAFSAPLAYANEVAGTTLTLPKVVLLASLAALWPHRAKVFALLAGARATIVAFGCIIAAIALSFIGATHDAAVLRELFKWLEYLLVFCVCYAAFAIDPRDRWIAFAFSAAIALVCASALVQEALGAPSGIDFGPGTVPRISGFLEGPNQLGGFLEVAAAFVAARLWQTPTRLLSALAGLVAFTVLLTFSRGGMIGCAIAVATVLLLSGAHRRALRAIPFAIGGAAGALGDALWIAAAHRVAALADPTPNVDHAGGVGHRSELWRAALYFFRHHPIVGIGAGNYELRLPEAGLPTIRTHANSWYLQALAEGGIVLFAATLFFIGSMLALLWRNARTSPWALAAFAATIALALHQVVDYLVFYPKVAEPWILLCAIGLADSRSPR